MQAIKKYQVYTLPSKRSIVVTRVFGPTVGEYAFVTCAYVPKLPGHATVDLRHDFLRQHGVLQSDTVKC